MTYYNNLHLFHLETTKYAQHLISITVFKTSEINNLLVQLRQNTLALNSLLYTFPSVTSGHFFFQKF